MSDVINTISKPPYLYIVIVFGLYIFVYIPYLVMKIKKNKKEKLKYESENPDISKVYTANKTNGVTSHAMFIHSVDNEVPHHFSEGMKTGFFVKPGTHIVELEYSWTRPGVMYKNVTKTVSKSKQEIEVEASKKYQLNYNAKKECYEFEEMEEKK